MIPFSTKYNLILLVKSLFRFYFKFIPLAMIPREIIVEMNFLLKEIDRTWNNVFASCKTTKDCHNIYPAFYRFMNEMTGICDTAIELLKAMVEEINWTLPDKKLDVNAIAEFTNCIIAVLMDIVLKETPIVKVDKDLVNIVQNNFIEEKTRRDKKTSGKDLNGFSNYSNTCIKKTKGMIDRTIASVDCKISLDIISSSFAFGLIVSACVFIDYNVTKYCIGFHKKRNLINLTDAMENLLGTINKLHCHKKFYQQIEFAIKQIKRTLALIEKTSKLSSKKHDTKKTYHGRVKNMAINMKQDTQKIISDFESLGNQIGNNKTLLDECILMAKTRAAIKHNK